MVTPKTFDPQAFLEFCRGKPRNETYDVSDPRVCALAQFGFPNTFYDTLEQFGIPRIAYFAALDCCQRDDTNTFGALSDRLEAALAEQSGL